MSNNWQSDQQQWFNPAGGGWSGNGNDSTGFDIPMDDYQQSVPAQDFFNSPPPPSQPPSYQHNAPKTHPFNSFGPPSDPADPTKSFGTMDYSYWSNKDVPTGGSIEEEPPLLEELGINFDHIRQKTFAVLNPLMTANRSVLDDNDLAGPLVFCLLFGFSLLLHGKVHFGFIYGIGVLGCLAIYALLNLMSPNGIALTCAVSVLGYCLLPMSLLSLLAAVLSFQGVVGLMVAISAVSWCSLSASKLFVTALTMDHQRILVAYPCALFYGLFALMAIY